MKIQNLTKAEEQVMQYLWELKKAFLKEILELFPEPKPHGNTVSTIIKVLKEKDFIDFQIFGRQHQYFAKISKEQYSGKSINKLINNYFDGSYQNAVSSFIDRNELSIEDLEFLLNELKSKP